MFNSTERQSRVRIRGKDWAKARFMSADKYQAISGAILSSLPKTPIAYSEVVKRVKARARSFSGSIPWHTIACLRELEVQGKVMRHEDPVRYSRR